MFAPPVVSILLPIRDAAATLDSCLSSLVDQTVPDWECLAIDDGSKDGSRDIIDRWAGRDARIRALDSPPPGGIVAALEKARRLARGAFLARQDADDRSLPARFAQQLEALDRDPRLAVVGCTTWTPGDLTDGMRRYLDWLAGCTDPETCARDIWIESPIAHPTAMIRSSIMQEVGGYRDCGWPEDYDLWLRIHRAGWRIGNLSDVLYEWTDSPGRLSRRDPRYSPDAFLRCKVHHLCRWFVEHGITRQVVVWGAGRDGKRLARALEAERGMPRQSAATQSIGLARAMEAEISKCEAVGEAAPGIVAFIDIDPRKIGRRRRGLPILDPDSCRKAFPGAFYLAAVGVAGARGLIRATLTGWGLSEGEDFVCLH